MKVRCPLERPRPSSWGGWPHASPRHRSGIAMDDVDRLPSMTVTARRYTSEPGFTDDFFAVREFLVRINADRVTTPAFLWGRWEWAFCLPYLDRDALNRIGVWESDGEVVGLVTYEEGPGDAYFAVDPAHRGLLPELVDHALTHLRHDGKVRLMVSDWDRDLQRIVHSRGLRATDGRDGNAVLDLTGPLEYAAPDGYRVISLAVGLPDPDPVQGVPVQVRQAERPLPAPPQEGRRGAPVGVDPDQELADREEVVGEPRLGRVPAGGDGHGRQPIDVVHGNSGPMARGGVRPTAPNSTSA